MKMEWKVLMCNGATLLPCALSAIMIVCSNLPAAWQKLAWRGVGGKREGTKEREKAKVNFYIQDSLLHLQKKTKLIKFNLGTTEYS